jgi:hypothetical protein
MVLSEQEEPASAVRIEPDTNKPPPARAEVTASPEPSPDPTPDLLADPKASPPQVGPLEAKEDVAARQGKAHKQDTRRKTEPAAKQPPDPKDDLKPTRTLEEMERTLSGVAKERGLATADLPWLSPQAANATKRWQANRFKDRDAAKAAVAELLDIVEHAHAGPHLLQLKLNRVSVGLSRAGGILAAARFTDLKSRFAELNGAVGTGLPQDEYDRLAVQIDDLEHDLGSEIASAQAAARAANPPTREAPSP